MLHLPPNKLFMTKSNTKLYYNPYNQKQDKYLSDN